MLQLRMQFYCDLSFGTGGLRGVIGAGTNRMNVFTVAKASQGLANYVNKHFPIFKRENSKFLMIAVLSLNCLLKRQQVYLQLMELMLLSFQS